MTTSANSIAQPVPARLLRGAMHLALAATVLSAVDHAVVSVVALVPDAGDWASRLKAIDGTHLAWASVQIVAAVLALPLGYLLVSLAYPLPRLSSLASSNPAAAIQGTAHIFGAAAVSTACFGGVDGQSFVIGAAYAGICWLALIVICATHRKVTGFRDQDEVAAGNIAAALASAGLHLSVALMVVGATEGTFDGWRPSLVAFGRSLVWVLALYPFRQFVVARLVLDMTPTELDRRVSVDRDPWIGGVEGLGYIFAALVLSSAW